MTTTVSEQTIKLSEIDLNSYDKVLIAFSGGKDSMATVLWAIRAGLKDKIELWHHLVDGREGSTLMDWKVTTSYCEKFAKAFDLPIYFSWKQGGFEGEMLRENSLTAPTKFETPEGEVKSVGGVRGKLGTRLKFPQVSGDLKVRWCSPYLKIGVCSAAIRNQKRFNSSRTLVVSGERAQESPKRAKYKAFEPDQADNRNGKSQRHVDRIRPIHGWTEEQIWQIIEDFRVNPHPAYHLGWGRLSCFSCIFGSANQWATIKAIAPEHFEKVAEYEEIFEVTIQQKRSIRELAAIGQPYQEALDNPEMVEIALSEEYTEPIFLEDWSLPSGAFGESNGSV